MDKNTFMKEMVKTIRELIPEDLQNIIIIEEKENLKNNDTKMHGITLVTKEDTISPIIYLEDLYEDYKNGVSKEDLVKKTIALFIEGYSMKFDLSDISLKYEDIEDKLTISLVDASINKERMKYLVYRPVDNGFAMIPQVNIKEDKTGRYSVSITKNIANSERYDIEKMLDKAYENFVNNNQPKLIGMSNALFENIMLDRANNPFDENFKLDKNEGMYILTSKGNVDGAAMLYYPDMLKRMGEVLDDSFYILPSSRYEVIITL